MKRRAFLASLGALAALAEPAAAAPAPAKPAPRRKRPANSAAPAKPPVRSASNPIIDGPPKGTSATLLPPVRAPKPPVDWTAYEIVTRVELRGQSGPCKLWLPLSLNQDTLFQRTLSHTWEGNPTRAGMSRQPDGDLEVFECEWADGSAGKLVLTTQVSTADRLFDITQRTVAPEREDILRRNLRASALIPNDGPAYQLGERIVGRVKDPVAQAKVLYDWVIDNAAYDPALPGSGDGNVRQQLESGQYGGRSVDINGLFVALCRAIGIPARCVFGLRAGASRLFRSLGLDDSDATRGQHARAEFYVPGYGWIPVDPSDVRRAMTLENLSDQDSRLASLKRVLFGVWEMNWIAYNVGTDIALDGQGETLPFLLLPRLETPNGHFDGSDPAAIQYSISARRI
ncbi:MAG: transglutaminase-like domain-containing protein [Betaproteobacteria bacterium]|nr:transglutaminase-like domain-containing protein [Betaproteobacteria bacterium]MCL2886725.1 transglutaminase-like domain-containing protein [Betaproteobacteria bacterium]